MSRRAYIDLIRYLARCALRAGLLALLIMATLVGAGAALHGRGHGHPAAWPPGVGGSPGYQGGTCYVGGQLCITWPNAAEDHPFVEVSWAEYAPIAPAPVVASSPHPCGPASPHRTPCTGGGGAGAGPGSGP